MRGARSPGEFAAAVRRAAREIGERVSCDARYIGRVEAGEIRCPNYAYERVFLHMFPGRTLADLGFAPRSAVRGRSSRGIPAPRTTPPAPTPSTLSNPSISPTPPTLSFTPAPPALPIPPIPPVPPAGPAEPAEPRGPATGQGPGSGSGTAHGPGEPTAPDEPVQRSAPRATRNHEESDVRRRAFMTGCPVTVAASLGSRSVLAPLSLPAPTGSGPGRAGAAEAEAVEEAVRRIRVLDDRHGADGLYRRAAVPLRTAFELLDAATARQSTADRLHAGAGELAISVGWLAHDSGRFADARSHYAEALATARTCGDAGVEAHAFCNSSFLARDAGRPREAVRAAQAAQRAARGLGSSRLLSLVALREAGGWAGLGDRTGCTRALARAQALFERGASDDDPEWMSFYGEAEVAGLEAQCWSALGEWSRAARYAERAVALQDPHFTRNTALYTAELADDLARAGRPGEAAAAGQRLISLLDEVQSSRIESMLATTARVLLPHRASTEVGGFLERYAAMPRPT
ncbi:tetratricopeptide repeat protein [Streptomyces sp. NPDC005955]|uniref:tetratricopeptide repeat protein n=1 Tax=Streptomyces sp. NPDC005955 TaxID=3364738 RepID=UPI0036742931